MHHSYSLNLLNLYKTLINTRNTLITSETLGFNSHGWQIEPRLRRRSVVLAIGGKILITEIRSYTSDFY